MKTKGIAVKLEEAERTRRHLSKRNLIRKDLKINRDKEFVYFPIREDISKMKSYKLVECDFEGIRLKTKTYKEVIKIPEKIVKELPTSYDIVGDIILIKLDNKLLKYKGKIGESLLISNKNVKTICLIKPVKGELRTRDTEIIAGKNRTKTIHKEYGLKFEVDIGKTYFSPRLANERKRVADSVKSDEIIVDMFAGVAPFSIMIAKYAKPKIIYALDKNKKAIEYAKKNAKINNVLDKVEIIYADARDIEKIFNKGNRKANRIIMNLPFSANKFFKYALKIISDSCIIHYYDILKEEKINERIKELERIAEKNKITLSNFDFRKIKTYAPREFYIGIDITAKQNMPM